LDSEGHAKLTDFGLAKQNVSDDTLNKSFCGSPLYLAPEIVKKKGHTRQVDWYILGVLMYDLMIGRPPFLANSKDELFKIICNKQVSLPGYLSPDCKDLITKVICFLFIFSSLKRIPN
jgi:serine/threonine protein kinase